MSDTKNTVFLLYMESKEGQVNSVDIEVFSSLEKAKEHGTYHYQYGPYEYIHNAPEKPEWVSQAIDPDYSDTVRIWVCVPWDVDSNQVIKEVIVDRG